MKILNKSSLLGLFIVMLGQPASAEDFVEALQELNQAKADWFVNAFKRAKDLDEVTETIAFQGMPVTFKHQLWKIPHESVCRDVWNDQQQYAKCTIAAKQLFVSLCNTPQYKRASIEKSRSRMFCDTAETYQPVQATVKPSGSAGQISGRQITEECRQAKLDAFVNPSLKTAKVRDSLCQ